jgi:hypothetical protein
MVGTTQKYAPYGSTSTLSVSLSVSNWMGLWSSGTTYSANQLVRSSEGHLFMSLVGSNLNHQPPTDGSDSAYWGCLVQKGAQGDAGVGGFWYAVPGSPVRVSNTSFNLTDSNNPVNHYDLLFQKRVVVKWTESNVQKVAMVTASSFSSPTVTVNIIGNAMASIDYGSLKYALLPALMDVSFVSVGTLGVLIDGTLGLKIRIPEDRWPFGIDMWLGYPGTTSGSTTCQVYDDGSSIANASVAYNASPYESVNNVATVLTKIAKGSYLTVGVSAIPGSQTSADLYVILYTIPDEWLYRA